jgi:hypothetical protein
VLHGIAGGPGIPTDDDIGMIPADSQSHSKSGIEQVSTENGAYAGGAKELHVTLILLLYE